jgi:endonuclease-8
MPEGPEIRRAADRLARALAGRRIERAWFGLQRLAHWGARLAGRRVLSIAPRGKALLIALDGGHTIYSHNQLYGQWAVARAGHRPTTTRQLRLALESDARAILLYSASDIEVLDARGLARHPYLARLGPDLLDPALNEQAIAARLGEPRFAGRSLAALLLDQGFVAGIGNYLRSEMLFEAGLDPALAPRRLDAPARARLARAILSIGRRAYRLAGVTNDPQRAAALKLEGVGFEARRFHVFGRDGLPCWTCGTPIERASAGGASDLSLSVLPACAGPGARRGPGAARPARAARAAARALGILETRDEELLRGTGLAPPIEHLDPGTERVEVLAQSRRRRPEP